MKTESAKKNIKIPIGVVITLILIHGLVGSISYASLFNLQALEIIFAGIIISIIISFSFENLIYTAKTVKSSFTQEFDYENDILKVYDMSIRIKGNGVLAIQDEMEHEDDIFLRDAMALLCDYKTSESIEDIMSKDIESRKIHMYIPYNAIKMIAHVSPAFGLIGTLVGLISLLSNMQDPQTIMNSMSSALVSTLYGSVIANFLAVPIMGRIKNYIDKNVLRYKIITEGVLLISKNDSPRNVFDKMNVMLEESDRLSYPKESSFTQEG